MFSFSKMMKIVGIIVAFIIIESEALPNGAPSFACSDLTPQHSPNQATGPFPYEVDVSAVVYVPDQSYSSKSATT